LRILRNFPHELPVGASFPVVAVGVFDGLHRGHQQVVERAVSTAGGRAVCVVTFDPHPRAVLGLPQAQQLLRPIDERLELFAAWPLAAVAVLRFDATIARMHYRDFVRVALYDGLGARHLVLGYDVRVGHDREGTPETLTALGLELGYTVDRVEALQQDGAIVSSTAIRRALEAGDVEAAARGLGRPYALHGRVIRGQGRGHGLGIPTANLELPVDKLVPANGVYAVRVHLPGGGPVKAGALNIGVVPTFGTDAPRAVEVHVLDHQGDLYGSRLQLDLVARLRAERRFPDVQALVAQVRADLEAARQRVAGAGA